MWACVCAINRYSDPSCRRSRNTFFFLVYVVAISQVACRRASGGDAATLSTNAETMAQREGQKQRYES